MVPVEVIKNRAMQYYRNKRVEKEMLDREENPVYTGRVVGAAKPTFSGLTDAVVSKVRAKRASEAS
jgi:hypothetical protein